MPRGSQKNAKIETKIIDFRFVCVKLFFENHVFFLSSYYDVDEWMSPRSRDK